MELAHRRVTGDRSIRSRRIHTGYRLDAGLIVDVDRSIYRLPSCTPVRTVVCGLLVTGVHVVTNLPPGATGGDYL